MENYVYLTATLLTTTHKKKFFNQMFTYIEKAYKNEILDLKLTLCAKIDPYLSK